MPEDHQGTRALWADTAGARVAERRTSRSRRGLVIAAEIHKHRAARPDVEDADPSVTRFLIGTLARMRTTMATMSSPALSSVYGMSAAL
jgi:hypothetical protein